MKTWKEIIRSDLKEMKIGKDVAKDRSVWKVFHKNPSIPCKHGKH